MSTIHLLQVSSFLEKQVFKYIDESKIKLRRKTSNEEELKKIVRSQAFSLFACKFFSNDSYSELQNKITDCFGDNGIDLIHYNKNQNTLYLIQSKWIQKGVGGVEIGEVHKFLAGVKDLVHLRFSKFNEDVRNLRPEIEKAILDDPNIKVTLVIAYSGNKLSEDIIDLINSTMAEFNQPSEMIFFKEFNIKNAHDFLKNNIEGEPIDTDLDIINWGYTPSPYLSFYGTASCGQLAEIFLKNSKRIFAKNIRHFVGNTEINKQIVDTLLTEPHNFIYLNNGITIVCKRLSRSLYGANDKSIGKFKVSDLSVINGAQTIASISSAFLRKPEKVNEAKVFLRVIEVNDANDEFDKKITVSSNSQNKIEKRDFVSIDEQQERIKRDLYLEGYNYIYKRSIDNSAIDDKTIYLEELTTSLACYEDDISLSTYAKREIGKLWEDIYSEPYTLLFNNSLNTHKILRCIKTHREAEKYIKHNFKSDDDNKLIVNQGYQFILYIIFHSIDKKAILDPNFNFDMYIKNELISIIKRSIENTLFVYSKLFDKKYPHPVFRNFAYCKKIKSVIFKTEEDINPGETLSLF
jgi:hypothetical protein